MSYSKTIIAGNLTRDPDIRENANGEPWATFSVAVNERKKDGDAWVDVPTYYDVKAFGWPAKTIVRKDLTKGDYIVVCGRMVQERWTDKKTGEARVSWKLIAEDVDIPKARPKAVEPAETVDAYYEEPLPF